MAFYGRCQIGMPEERDGMEYIPAKTIVTKNKSADWFGNDYNMNIYRGCCHGCIYCDSRSDCYRVEEFDRVRGKANALEIIRNDLRRKVKKGVIGTGAMSDPYNPFEKELCLTRHALELIDAYEFGVSVATKSTLLVRDMDILQSIQEHSPVLAKITITTAEDALARKIEPGVPSSTERFGMLEQLRTGGILAGILLMPLLPFIEDSEENIVQIVRRAAACGATFIYPTFGVTLRGNQRIHYYEKLGELFPEQDLAAQYQKRYGSNYHCRVPGYKRLYELFRKECERFSILYQMKDIIHFYKKNYGDGQLRLFD